MAASTAPSAQRHMPVGRLVALEIPSVVVCSIGPLSVVDVPPPHRVMHLFASFGLVGFQFFKSNYFSKFKIQIQILQCQNWAAQKSLRFSATNVTAIK
jgi:hypothetical protein